MIYRFFESLTYKGFTARFSPYCLSLAIIFCACLWLDPCSDNKAASVRSSWWM